MATVTTAIQRQKPRKKNSAAAAVRRERARRVLERSIEFIYDESFDDPAAEAGILGPPPEQTGRNRLAKAPAELPPYLASLYQFPLLTKEQEQYYFRKMNFLKYCAARMRKKLNKSRPGKRRLEKVEACLREADEIKNMLIRRNLRLVVSIARKYVRPGTNFFEMVSDGNVALMRAVEKFDYSRGFKFSTYATWAVRRMLARSVPAEQIQLTRYRTGTDELFRERHDSGSSRFEQLLTNRRQKDAVNAVLKKLDSREREIIKSRFGLKKGTEPQTLEQVGNEFGVSKERVRQLEHRALRKMRQFAVDQKLDIPDVQ